MQPAYTLSLVAGLLLGSISATAQVSIQLDDSNAKPFIAQGIDTQDGLAAKPSMTTYFKAHFSTRLDAERILAQLMVF